MDCSDPLGTLDFDQSKHCTKNKAVRCTSSKDDPKENRAEERYAEREKKNLNTNKTDTGMVTHGFYLSRNR